MSRRCFLHISVSVAAILLTARIPTTASDPSKLLLEDAAVELSPMLDDAGLHDVAFVGTRRGWAVGNRGVIHTTHDGGRSWEFVSSPVDCSLRSVCFLSDRVGWIAGGGTTLFTRLGYGVVLSTNDGGRSWRRLSSAPLPRLYHIKFFTLNVGLAVGDATAAFPTGVLLTNDGGVTWRPAPGPKQTGWRAGAFLSPDVGVVAGRQGRTLVFGGGRLLPQRIDRSGLRSMHAVDVQPDGRGWMVGDGGVVLATANAGVDWLSPPSPLPRDLRDFVDFRAVETHGENVWIAGSPGGVIWHSPDAGRNWTRQYTAHTAPLNALCFTSRRDGCAVGELGTVLVTRDGGQTWRAARGGGRRAAMMSVHARPERAAFAPAVVYSGEYGYRSVTLLPARRDVGPDGRDETDLDVRLHDAMLAAGGNAGEMDWRFPVALPGLDKNGDRLLEDWNERSEGRLREAFLGDLVGRIRTWRPDVILLDEPAADDAATAVINDAVLRAVDQAADSTRHSEQRRLAGLDPWQVKKVYLRLVAGSTGDLTIDRYRHLPRLDAVAADHADPARSLVTSVALEATRSDAYRLLRDLRSGAKTQPRGGDLFTGVALAPGGAARRRLLTLDEADLKRREQIAARRRNLQAYGDRFLEDERMGAQLIAQLRETTAGMSDRQASIELSSLAGKYRRIGRWDLVESTLLELVTRFPGEPASADGMRWLFQLWTGAETAWRRAGPQGVRTAELEVDGDAIESRVRRAFAEVQTPINERTGDDHDASDDVDPVSLLQRPGVLGVGENQGWRNGQIRNWHMQALSMAALIRRRDAVLYASPAVQYPLAALLRENGALREAGRVYGGQIAAQPVRNGNDSLNAQSPEGGPWADTAESEVWLTHMRGRPRKPILACRRAEKPPVLDGVLSDVCWQNADEVALTTAPDDRPDGNRHALVMLSWDDRHLYVAASVPRDPRLPKDAPVEEGRRHDANLSGFDRIGLFLDVDRDYASWYSFEVDQRGRTTEACWEDFTWNPRWYVAADADDRRWRMEAAVPLESLVPQSPGRNTVWAVGIRRVLPAVGVESWTHPASTKPRPETFGLLRFE